MRKRKYLFLMCLGFWLSTSAQQQAVTLDQCLAAALKNHPLSEQNALYDKSGVLQQQNSAIGKLPQLNLNGQATYQSAVTEIPIKVPGFTAPVIPKAQYKLTLDVNQLIYGGGTIDFQQQIQDYDRQMNQVNNTSELYKIKERISQLYFNILLVDENELVLGNTIKDLLSKQEKINSGVKNGILLASTADVIESEILKAGQRLLELKSQRSALIATLQVFTGSEIAENAVFTVPETEIDLSNYTNLRPEYKTFGLAQQKLRVSQQMASSRDLPKVYGFATAGYGQPGLNMFKEESDFFYLAGIKASWNFWNWHQTHREQQLLDLSSQVIENQKRAYDLANQALVQQYIADIAKSNELLKTDDEIIRLKKEISKSAAAQVENGTLTASEYVSERLAEEQALLTQNLHRLQLLQAKWLYKAATGDL